MKLFKATSLFVLPLVVPMLLAGCGGEGGTASTESPVAAKPEDAKAEEGTVETWKEAGLQFTLPKGWKTETKHTGTLQLIDSPDGGVSIALLRVPSNKTVDGLLAESLALSKKNFKNYKAGKEETETINGMEFKSFVATGDIEGFGPRVMKNGSIKAQEPIVFSVTMDKAEAEADDPDWDKVMHSIEKMEKK